MAKDEAEAQRIFRLMLQNAPEQIQWETHNTNAAKTGPLSFITVTFEDEEKAAG